ncbi:aspartyl protease family protein [Maribellus maritimus]|uniref:aspartyl protease family protein n=1 Tax=Maribellus maritimus TaxID=2870838 RepID=UPI001EEC71C3|nr:aspartyl protease family protein [Maribellus maritimus]MCG6190756.1 aspartyl protease family protein [Maribellus maritimus]
MKTLIKKIGITTIFAIAIMAFIPKTLLAQETKTQALDQNISIYAEDEPLADVIEKICDYLNLDYSYNSSIVEDKKISLNVSNKPIKFVLDKLMKDFYLLFEIEDNILVVRDYVPLEQSIDFEESSQQFFGNNRGFLFDDPRKKSITVKFKSASNLIIIPVNINDSDTLNFILDTGVRHPIITELPFVNKLNLNYMMPIQIKGLGEGEELTAYRSGNNSLSIDGLTARNQEVQMIIDENFQISHMLGIPVHGLIGFNLFKDYVVEIDYLNEQITLNRPEYYKYRDRRKDIVLPLMFDGNKPFVRTSIVTDELKEVPVKLLVDTGASDAIWLSEKSDSRIGLPQNHIETFLGRGLNGDLYGVKGRIDGIWVGPLVLPKPIVAFPNSELIDQLISSNDRNGTIGAEILRRFRVTIDYRNSRLTLRPTHKVKDDFNYNMSGMEIINPMPGLPIFTITNIRENSPAFYAGLKENDQILSINSSNHQSLELNDINLLLQSRENKKIKVKVLRDGEEFKTSFELKRMF